MVPEKDETYYIPDVETYFKGEDRVRRDKGITASTDFSKENVKFFITEGPQVSNLAPPVQIQ